MKLRYDRDEDILLIELVSQGLIDHADQSGPIISHFATDGSLVLLEILDASRFLTSALQVAMRGNGEPVAVPVAS